MKALDQEWAGDARLRLCRKDDVGWLVAGLASIVSDESSEPFGDFFGRAGAACGLDFFVMDAEDLF